MNAKERRIEARREKNRSGLSERQWKHYVGMLRRGYSYEVAILSARQS